MVGFKLLQIQRLEDEDNGFYCQNSDCNKFTEYKYGVRKNQNRKYCSRICFRIVNNKKRKG